MEQFAQKLITTTTLGEQISIGEYNGHNTNAKPGEYKVYEITNEGDIYAILFVHVDETQDVNELLKTLDIEVNCGVDGGTYGIITAPEKLSYDNWMNTTPLVNLPMTIGQHITMTKLNKQTAL